MRLLDKTMLTEDEGWNPPTTVARWVERLLERLKMDSYNAQYLVRITVDRLDDPEPEEDD